MRNLTRHKGINELNDAITVTVQDEPGIGGACHEYQITVRDPNYPLNAVTNFLSFQTGPIKENGYNGITQEALLTVLIDRLEGFQSGRFACDDNAEALSYLYAALDVLLRRTKSRVERGVEGTYND